MTLARRFGLIFVMVGLVSTRRGEAQEFKFRDGGSEAIAVTIAEVNGAPVLQWPKQTDAWHTALLDVQVAADAAALAPYVEISAGVLSARQYVAPGTTGRAWLNLSFLGSAAKPPAEVTLRGEGVTIPPGAATLRLFAGDPISPDPFSFLRRIQMTQRSPRSGCTRTETRAL
jgi:hypothetical protein